MLSSMKYQISAKPVSSTTSGSQCFKYGCYCKEVIIFWSLMLHTHTHTHTHRHIKPNNTEDLKSQYSFHVGNHFSIWPNMKYEICWKLLSVSSWVMLLNKCRKKCFSRTLWCQSQGDLWPFRYNMSLMENFFCNSVLVWNLIFKLPLHYQTVMASHGLTHALWGHCNL